MIATLFDENPALRSMAAKLQRARAEGQLVLQPGDVGYASAPSNIALLKYWGKQSGRRQIPVNSSLSMTLSGYRSFTSVTVQGCFDPAYMQSGRTVVARPPFVLQLNQKDVPMPGKMEQFLKNLLAPYAPEISLRVSSINNFPTACGVASSASGYAALVAAVADVLNLRRFLTDQELHTWLVEWSRLGSGSATRSALLMREADQEQSQFENNFVA